MPRRAGRSQGAAAQFAAGTKAANVVSTDQIVASAVRICDSDGIESMTIRRLAAELDIGPMTVYGYFRSKEEILDGIADHVLGSLEVPDGDDRGPAAAARRVAEAIFAMMRRHPSVVHLLASRTTMSEQSLRAAMDAVLGMLREAGFSDVGSVRAYALIMTYCLGFASYQMPRPWGRADREDVDELRRQRKHFYSSLSLPDFRNLVELSELATMMPSDEQFAFGLDCLIDGLVAQPGILRAAAGT